MAEAEKPQAIWLVPVPARQKLNFGDSIGLLSFIVGVVFVIITPPLWLKAAGLVFCACGCLVFSQKSHWTYNWSHLGRWGAGIGLVVILAAIGTTVLPLAFGPPGR